MLRLSFFVLAASLSAFLGCSGSQYVPVSGVVKVDGKPYGKAAVSFQPIGTQDNPNPGRGSSAYTDENGRFVLFSDENDGAVVGKHLVRITTRANELKYEEGVGSADDARVVKPIEVIPPEWNAESQKEFEVPPGGTDQANFDIQSSKK
jgi:hypothetical protein